MRSYFFVLYCYQHLAILRGVLALWSNFFMASSFASSMASDSSTSSSSSYFDSVKSFSSRTAFEVSSGPFHRISDILSSVPYHVPLLDTATDDATTSPNIPAFNEEYETVDAEELFHPHKEDEVGGLSKPLAPTLGTSSGFAPTTRRNIYIRGQRISPQNSSRSGATKMTALSDSRNGPEGTIDFQDGDVDNGSNGANETFANVTTKKRTVFMNRRRFYNFKLLHDTLQGENDSRHGESQFYALLYGVGILLVTSIVTLVVCLLLGICRQKIKSRLDKRRRFDKSGEYERVDSVSSIVDSACSSQMEPYVDDVIEDVTII